VPAGQRHARRGPSRAAARSTALGEVSLVGFRVLPGALRLSLRRKRRFAAARAAWESAFARGAVDGLGLQRGYASALAITAHADAIGWRAAELGRRPAPSEELC